jgi:D-glycero-D-manno-heptose 1,7-bisphosphate phosphatase
MAHGSRRRDCDREPAWQFQPAAAPSPDGVIVADTHYLCRVEDMHMIAGAAAAIGHCNVLQIPVVVVTNQVGIGRGYCGWDAFHAWLIN